MRIITKKAVEILEHILTKTDVSVIRCWFGEEFVNRSSIMSLLDMHRSTAHHYLSKLVKKGIARKLGSHTNTRYILTNLGQELIGMV